MGNSMLEATKLDCSSMDDVRVPPNDNASDELDDICSTELLEPKGPPEIDMTPELAAIIVRDDGLLGSLNTAVIGGTPPE